MNQKTKTDGKDRQRIVLNLNKAQADALNALLSQTMGNSTISQYGRDISKILQKRIEKTINKHENSEGKIKRMQEEGADDSEIVQETGYHTEEECPECNLPENECECPEEIPGDMMDAMGQEGTRCKCGHLRFHHFHGFHLGSCDQEGCECKKFEEVKK